GLILGFLENLLREMVGQMKLANRDFDVDSEIVFAAKDLNDASARILCRRGPVGDLNVYHHAFEVVPLRAPHGFFAEHAILRLSLWPLCPEPALSGVERWFSLSNTINHRGLR